MSIVFSGNTRAGPGGLSFLRRCLADACDLSGAGCRNILAFFCLVRNIARDPVFLCAVLVTAVFGFSSVLSSFFGTACLGSTGLLRLRLIGCLGLIPGLVLFLPYRDILQLPDSIPQVSAAGYSIVVLSAAENVFSFKIEGDIGVIPEAESDVMIAVGDTHVGLVSDRDIRKLPVNIPDCFLIRHCDIRARSFFIVEDVALNGNIAVFHILPEFYESLFILEVYYGILRDRGFGLLRASLL